MSAPKWKKAKEDIKKTVAALCKEAMKLSKGKTGFDGQYAKNFNTSIEVKSHTKRFLDGFNRGLRRNIDKLADEVKKYQSKSGYSWAQHEECKRRFKKCRDIQSGYQRWLDQNEPFLRLLQSDKNFKSLAGFKPYSQFEVAMTQITLEIKALEKTFLTTAHRGHT